MNQVFLSGIIAEEPRLTQPEGTAAHLLFPLRVRHRTAKGVVKQELYTVNAWNNVALWGAKQLGRGQLVAIQGYLTQHTRENGVLSVEVTADEFLPARMSHGQKGMAPTDGKPDAREAPAENASPEEDEEAATQKEQDGIAAVPQDGSAA